MTRYIRRHKKQLDDDPRSDDVPRDSDRVICRTPPPTQGLLQAPQQILIPEKLLYSLDGLIRESFESGAWRFFDNERLIESSPAAVAEQRALMSFLGSVDQGCTATRIGHLVLADAHWQRAIVELEVLLRGTYHDIIPNIISKLTDLDDWGFADVANRLMREMVGIASACKHSGIVIFPLYEAFDGLILEGMSELEDRVWEMFHSVFQLYLGSYCYNTFVMMMDRAQRKLQRDKDLNIDHHLPPLQPLDDQFGILNCRSLDVLRMRVETFYQRREYVRVTEEASSLIVRAERKLNDPWKRHYFLIKAYYHSGNAHFYLGNFESTTQHLSYALYLEEEFCKLDQSYQFGSERIFMKEKLDRLHRPCSTLSAIEEVET